MTPPIPPPLPNQIAEKLYYYTDSANQPVGPVPYSVLLRLADAKVIRPVDYVREKGTSEWVQFDSISRPSVPQPVPKDEGALPVGSPRNLRLEIEREFGLSNDGKKRLLAPLFYPVAFLLPHLGLRFTKQAGIAIYAFVLLMIIAPFIGSQQSGARPDRTSQNKTQERNGGKNMVGNLLTKDQRNWRLAKAKTKMYSDEKAFADAQTFFAQGRTIPLARMAFEDRLFSFPTMVKVELVRQEARMARVRVYRIVQDHTFELLVSPEDLLPYDENAEKQAIEEGKARIAEQVASLAERMKLKGKQVAIKPNASVFVDIDVLWEEIENARDDKPGSNEKMEAWLKSGKVFSTGANSTGVVSGDGPYHKWVLIESQMDGKPLRFWALNKDISVIAQEPVGDKPEKPDEKIKGIVRDVLGSSMKAVQIQKAEGGSVVWVDYDAKWIMSGRKLRIDEKMKDVYQALFTNRDLGIQNVTISVFLPFVDKYGNKESKVGYTTRMDSDTAQRIRWENRYSVNFDEVWQVLFEHPDFRN